MTAATDPFHELAAREPVLLGLMTRFGRPDPFHWGWAADRQDADAFRSLLLQIVSQRVPAHRSFTLFDRVETAAGAINPIAILKLGAERLRAVGLTEAKARSSLDLATRVLNGQLDLQNLPEDDEEAIAALTTVRGIGRWSAQMFLIGYLHRPDVLPSGDYGIRQSIRTAWSLAAQPSAVAVDRMALPWSPYRTYAAVLLWTARLKGRDSGLAPDGVRGKYAAAESSLRSSRSASYGPPSRRRRH